MYSTYPLRRKSKNKIWKCWETEEIQENVGNGGVVIKNNEEVLYKEKFEYQPFSSFEKNYSPEQKSTKRRIKILYKLLILIMTSSLGDTIRKDTYYKREFKTERWMEINFDAGVEEGHKLQNGGDIVRRKKMKE